MASCSKSPIRSRQQSNSLSSQEQYNNNHPIVQSSQENTPTMQQSTDVNNVKIDVSSHYHSPSLSSSRRRRSISSTGETSPNEPPEVISLCLDKKPVLIPIQPEINNDDPVIDITKPINDKVTIRNECNANRQSSVNKKSDNRNNICDVL